MAKTRILFIVYLILISPSFYALVSSESNPAPLFEATTVDGRPFSLNDSRGSVVILRIQNFENPICIECEQALKKQLIELSKLSVMSKENITIVTLNIRKNPSSDNGKQLAEEWYGINVTWYWIEDYQPYNISNRYSNYWNLKGGFVNPTIILIDPSLNIVGVYHVYRMGEGEIDGVQTAESLADDADMTLRGEWNSLNVKENREEVTFLGMFILGIITALSPCSIALLISMISYVGASRSNKGVKREIIEGFKIGFLFTLGMSLVFFILGCFISSLGMFIEISTLF